MLCTYSAFLSCLIYALISCHQHIQFSFLFFLSIAIERCSHKFMLNHTAAAAAATTVKINLNCKSNECCTGQMTQIDAYKCWKKHLIDLFFHGFHNYHFNRHATNCMLRVRSRDDICFISAKWLRFVCAVHSLCEIGTSIYGYPCIWIEFRLD